MDQLMDSCASRMSRLSAGLKSKNLAAAVSDGSPKLASVS